MENDQSQDKSAGQLRAAYRAASDRLRDEVNNAMMIISIRLDLLRRNLNSRDEKMLNGWIDEIALALQRIKFALSEHARKLE